MSASIESGSRVALIGLGIMGSPMAVDLGQGRVRGQRLFTQQRQGRPAGGGGRYRGELGR